MNGNVVAEGVPAATVERVAKLPLFAPMPGEAVRRLMAASHVENRRRGHVLFHRGEKADRFYVVLSGQVALMLLEDGREEETIIEVIGPSDVFAEAAIFDKGIFPVSAKVIEDAELLVVPAAPFFDHLNKNFALVLAMMADMSARLRGLVRQISDLKVKSTGQRIGSFLLQLTDATTGMATVRLPFEKKMLAKQLGMKPESLSRALVKLREIGVEGHDDTLLIADVARLRRFCQE